MAEYIKFSLNNSAILSNLTVNIFIDNVFVICVCNRLSYHYYYFTELLSHNFVII